ncbi:unnamed protein product, partial [Nesidiocoris tenuis]
MEAETTAQSVTTEPDLEDAEGVEDVANERIKRGISQVKSHSFPLDTFLDMTGWGK